MCFSAGASFTAGAALTVAGMATTASVRRPAQRLFSIIPLIFGIQQVAEGWVWVTLQNPGNEALQKFATYFFMIVADVVWPVLIPASILMFEESPERRKILKILLGGGAVLSLYYGTCLALVPQTPEVLNCHINYSGEFVHALIIPAFLLYLVVTIPPFFISTVKWMRWLGTAMFVSVSIAAIFYVKNVSSVWCYFAAVLSILMLFVIREDNKARELSPAT
jgi:hypothetical protein